MGIVTWRASAGAGLQGSGSPDSIMEGLLTGVATRGLAILEKAVARAELELRQNAMMGLWTRVRARPRTQAGAGLRSAYREVFPSRRG
jgi:hypothetical protein